MARLLTLTPEAGQLAQTQYGGIFTSTTRPNTGLYSFGFAGSPAWMRWKLTEATGLREIYLSFYISPDHYTTAWAVGIGNKSSTSFSTNICLTFGCWINPSTPITAWRGYIGTELQNSLIYPSYDPNGNRFEAYIKVDNSTGRLVLKKDGIIIIDYTGDTDGSADSDIGYIYLLSYYYSYMDDIAVNDTSGTKDNSWIGDIRIAALYPNGNGDSSQLVGSDGNSTDNYLLVDETTPASDSDSTYVETTTSGYYDLYNMTNLASSDIVINRIIPLSHAKNTVALGNYASLPISVSGVLFEGQKRALTLSYVPVLGSGEQVGYTENPNTGLPWTVDDIQNIQIGFKSENDG